MVNSGGTIQNTTTGVIFSNAGSVELDWVKLSANQTGVSSTNNDYVALFRLDADDNTGYAVDSLNDSALGIGSSTFDGNGALGEGTIRMQSGQLDNYQVEISNSTITDGRSQRPKLLKLRFFRRI